MITDRVKSLITLEQAAEQLSVSPSKVKRYLEEHILFAVKIDKQLMIPAELIIDNEPLSSIRGTMLQLLDLGLTE